MLDDEIYTASRSIADAIKETLISLNESDSNFEPANIIDGIYALGRTHGYHAKELTEAIRQITSSLENVATAIADKEKKA